MAIIGRASSAQTAVAPLVCDGARPALQLRLEGALTAPQVEAFTLDVAVEAAVLELAVCTEPPAEPAAARATVSWGEQAVRVEVRARVAQAERTFSRELPVRVPLSDGALLETALIVSDMVREALRPPAAPAPAQGRWSVVGRAAFEVFGTPAWLFGGEAGLRLRPLGPVVLELSAGGRGAVPTASARGLVQLASVGGGLSALGVVLEGTRGRLAVEAGLRLTALQLRGEPTADALGSAAWALVVTGVAGLEGALRVGAVWLTLRSGPTVSLLGATARVDGAAVTGVAGAGFYATVGVEGWRW